MCDIRPSHDIIGIHSLLSWHDSLKNAAAAAFLVNVQLVLFFYYCCVDGVPIMAHPPATSYDLTLELLL